jgi:hypothetical protein
MREMDLSSNNVPGPQGVACCDIREFWAVDAFGAKLGALNSYTNRTRSLPPSVNRPIQIASTEPFTRGCDPLGRERRERLYIFEQHAVRKQEE